MTDCCKGKKKNILFNTLTNDIISSGVSNETITLKQRTIARRSIDSSWAGNSLIYNLYKL